ncbi:F-box only protein 39 [Biomphalaria glabrata]|nr:F-box only protein 39-like [Biomphalaria glabrata]
MERKRRRSSHVTQPTTNEKKSADVQAGDEASISCLPLEILEHIFSFLLRNDRLQAMSVCSTWKSLILKSSRLWRSQTYVFNCTLPITPKKKADLLFCVQHFGPHMQTLSIKCRHPCLYICQKMAHRFSLFLNGLNAQAITSFKVSNLGLGFTRTPALKNISNTLAQMFARQRLKVFEMPKAYWPEVDGHTVLDTVFQTSRNNLETLNINEYFFDRTLVHIDQDWFSSSLTSLTKLTKLSIDLSYLTDELIISLARARRGELAYLSLWVKLHFSYTAPVIHDSWIYLTKACPDMEVEFKIESWSSKPSELIPAILDSTLPVRRLKLQISHSFGALPTPAYQMEIVLDHVTKYYGERLESFKLKFNIKEFIDQSLLMLVRDCPRLVQVKITAAYRSSRTARTVDKIVTERRQSHLNNKTPPNKKVCTDRNSVDNTSPLEDPMEGPSGLKGASQQ